MAVGAAVLTGVLTPNRYTSTASILIEPPTGSDPRTFTAISPIYLESLKTYETFAGSDTLFQRALEKFHLRGTDSSTPIESIKARVLKVSKLRDTKILQINVTLENAKQAQAMAQYIAEETVSLISSTAHATGRDLMEDLRSQADDAKAKMEQVLGAYAQADTQFPVSTLRTELDAMIDLLYKLRSELYESEGAAAQFESEGAKARVALLAKRVHDVEQSVAQKSKILAQASARLDRLDAEKRTTLANYETAARRLQDFNSWAGASGERLKVIDPGIVPERPSAPRTGLYAAVAGGLALLGSIVYLSFRYGLRT